MPLDTLEELRLLYNLQVGDSKLLQIVLFGQPELNTKLDQPNMRQLKDRIVHHFHMQPLSRKILESYLMFRMRAAGYRGPNIFSPGAIKLIAKASSGLMRRVNILADKSLLAAFVEDTYYIKTQHVQAAMLDSDLRPSRFRIDRKFLLAGAATAILSAVLAAWWMTGQKTGAAGQNLKSSAPLVPAIHPNSPPAPVAAATANQAGAIISAPAASGPIPKHDGESSGVAATTPPAPQISDLPATITTSLFEQRLAAGKDLLAQATAPNKAQGKPVASIQLFYNEEIDLGRIEAFLRRAEKLGNLQEIYLLPIKFGSPEKSTAVRPKDGVRVLYGAYPSVDAARKATRKLPARYREAFATSIHIF